MMESGSNQSAKRTGVCISPPTKRPRCKVFFKINNFKLRFRVSRYSTRITMSPKSSSVCATAEVPTAQQLDNSVGRCSSVFCQMWLGPPARGPGLGSGPGPGTRHGRDLSPGAGGPTRNRRRSGSTSHSPPSESPALIPSPSEDRPTRRTPADILNILRSCWRPC